MTKHERELRLMIKRHGLEAGEFRQNNGRYHVDLTAPNGATKKFYFSVQTNDPHALKNSDADLRRFTQANQVPTAHNPFPTPPQPKEPPVSTTTETNVSHKKNEDPSRQRNQLDAKAFYRLCEWCKTADLQGCYTFDEVAKRATASLGIKITEANVKTAFDTVSLLLPQDPSKPTRAAKGTTMNERALARALVALMQELGKDPGNDLLKIAA